MFYFVLLKLFMCCKIAKYLVADNSLQYSKNTWWKKFNIHTNLNKLQFKGSTEAHWYAICFRVWRSPLQTSAAVSCSPDVYRLGGVRFGFWILEKLVTSMSQNLNQIFQVDSSKFGGQVSPQTLSWTKWWTN